MVAAPKHFAAPISELKPSPLNPRKTIDESELSELAQSIMSKGVLQSLLVRPLKKGKGYEIICGERRYRAAKIAKLKVVPVVVRHDLDDQAALEAMVIENSQRKDVHPLEEADGIAALRDAGRTIEEIAAKLGRPPAFCHRRLVLLQLGPTARKAFMKGRLSVGAAEVLATVPTPKLQEEALQACGRYEADQPLSRLDLVHEVRNYRLALVDAPFALDDASLVPKAGACTNCPKRTSAQTILFDDVSKGKDHCLDPDCFDKKRAARSARRVEEAKGAGREVLDAKAAKKLWPHEYTRHVQGTYVDLDAGSDGYGHGRHWREVLGKGRMPEDITVAVNPHTGLAHELVRYADVKKILAANPKKNDPGSRSGGFQKSPADKKRELEGKAKGKAHRRAVEQLQAKLAEPMKGALGELALFLVDGMLARVYGVGALEKCAARRGWSMDKKEDLDDAYERARAIVRAAASGGVERAIPIALELVIEEQARSLGTTYDHMEPESFVARAMDYFGVDWLALEKEELELVREKASAKKGKRKKKTAPADDEAHDAEIVDEADIDEDEQ